ncbi:MAG TPA: trypsin-like peptidase domain-containing protein [Chloroflexia bacterium]|nr:trypsin-like peptidase domain-containing protein [Chloroflexia bacterium]
MGRYIKAGLATLLVVMLLALSGLAVANTASQAGGLASLLASAQVQTSGPEPSRVVSVDAPAQANPAAPAAPQQQVGVLDARSAVRATGPAVVTVVNTLEAGGDLRNSGFEPTARGSGVIIDRRGYIVTNYHVVEGQRSLEVIFSDGNKAPATLVGTDDLSDLAVIKVDVTVPAVALFGDSDKLETGQPVVAIGSALGDFRNTVTAGIISGLNRDLDARASPGLRDLIQTDAAINHGNSGGPLIDLQGNVIGINVAVVRDGGMIGDVAEGLGFAIPSNTAKEVTSQLIQDGSVERPYVGVSYQIITPRIAAYYDLPRDSGIYVSEVRPGSPADKAGIKANSIITKFDGVELTEDTSLLELLLKHKVGDTVKLMVLPEGETTEQEFTIVLGTRPAGE